MFFTKVLRRTSTGFLGFGTLNSAVATGLLTSSKPPDSVIISNRSAAKGKELFDLFPTKVTIAENNQQLLDASTTVFVAVLPDQAKKVLTDLQFRPDHRIVSLMAGIPNEELTKLMPEVQPQNIIRAVPLPPVKNHAGVTIIYPPDKEVVDLFNLLGTSVPVNDVDDFNKLPVMTCMMGSYYAYLETCHQWLVEHGVDSSSASTYVGALMHSIASDGKEAGAEGFHELIEEQTPGGYNEMGMRELREAGVWDEYKATLTSIAARWEGEASGSEKRPVTEREAKLAELELRKSEQFNKTERGVVKTENILSAKGQELLFTNPEAFEAVLGQVKAVSDHQNLSTVKPLQAHKKNFTYCKVTEQYIPATSKHQQ